jgi:hypothetical protein
MSSGNKAWEHGKQRDKWESQERPREDIGTMPLHKKKQLQLADTTRFPKQELPSTDEDSVTMACPKCGAAMQLQFKVW